MTIGNVESVEQQKLDELLSSYLFDSFPEACVIFDQHFYIIRMNSKAEKIFLFPKEYMMSKPFWEVAPQYINTNLFHAMYKIKHDREEITLQVCRSITNRSFEGTLRMIGNSEYKRYLNVVDEAATINEEKLKQAELFDGLYILQTILSYQLQK